MTFSILRTRWPGIVMALLGGTVTTLAGEPLNYNRDVRPILSDKCFTCHGPDEGKRQAELRLDVAETTERTTATGAAIIDRDAPDESELMRRILAEDEAERMPPADSNKKLTSEEIQTLRQWIAEGAVYSAHWAFTPPQRPMPPAVQDTQWPRNEIDFFILAALEKRQLRPAREADKATLLRRLSLDLIGLPPTPAEVDAFLADTAPEAYERVVDRLLQSPHYGERMAMPWLDGARYADSNGYQADFERYMWRWRDWVIDAFNRNLPFDQFTIEQLAGDLLPNATREQRLATGYHRNHRINTEGGIIAEEWRVETVIDRVETTGAVWLGLTLGCARCHSHKYDPLTQKEFYQLFAFFNNVPESGVGAEQPVNHPPLLPAPRPEDELRLQALERGIAEAEQVVRQQESQLAGYQAAWEKTALSDVQEKRSAWRVVRASSARSSGGSTLSLLDDGSYLVGGTNPSHDVVTLELPLPTEPVTGLRLEVLPHESLPGGSFGRHANGNFVLGEFEAEVGTADAAPARVRFGKALADYSQANWTVERAIDGQPQTGWAADGNDPAKRVPRQAIFLPETVIQVPAGGRWRITLRHEALDTHGIGRFRISWTGQPSPALPDSQLVPENVATALLVPPAERSAEQRQTLTAYFRAHLASPLRDADQVLAAARKAKTDFEASLPTVMVMEEMAEPRQAFLLVRGQYDKRGEPVVAGLPAFLPPLPDGQPANRLGLARWLVDPRQPLTARVTVNRLWEKYFGTGIVKSTENFGLQSEFPSHPELLDWLATEFVQLGWDLKAIQKTIVMSNTYRQSSARADVDPALGERDPENRLLARGPRFRLTAELIRDQALAIGGLLQPAVGGPSVRPYQPEGVWDETNVYGNLRNYRHDKGDGLYRRSMYTIWKRTAAPPQMLMFDAPGREICTVKRSRTNTPLQALTLLNDVTFVEAARALAQRMIREGGGDPAARITLGFRCATARPPDAAELEVLVGGLGRRLDFYRAHLAEAEKLITQGELARPADLDPAELAAYTLTASVLLNLDETVTKE